MRIWITGDKGFLGNHLSEALKKKHFVDGNDSGVCSSAPISYSRKIDCCSFKAMDRLLKEFKPDVLVHCAATAHEGLSSFSPSFITKNIFEASIATFSAAIKNGVKHIVFMSSMARYGKQELPFNEEMVPQPVDPYGVAKVAAEDVLKILCKTHGINYTILVPHNIIGIKQKYDDPARNVVSIMINRALQGKPIIIYGDGKQRRCFSPVKDCIPSIMKVIDESIYDETINIGPDEGDVSILDIARMVIKYTKKVDIIFMPDRPNEVKEAYCSSDKARKLLNYKPKQKLENCISEMVDYIKGNGTKPFNYFFPIEIERGIPKTWLNRLI
jgi:UDP-glucose 4-epimerase